MTEWGYADATAAAADLFGFDLSTADAIASHLRPVQFRTRAVIYRQGELSSELYVICSGKVKLTRRRRTGHEHVFPVLGPRDIFGELSAFDPGPRTSRAVAVTPVRAFALSRDALRLALVDNPEFAEYFLRLLACRMRHHNDYLISLSHSDVASRVARQLLELARRFGVQDQPGLWVTHGLTQAEFAQLVGASREAVNQALGEFADRGWITVRTKRVAIRRPKSLARRAV